MGNQYEFMEGLKVDKRKASDLRDIAQDILNEEEEDINLSRDNTRSRNQSDARRKRRMSHDDNDPSRLKIQKFLPKRTGSSSSYSMEMSNDFWKDDLSGVSYGSVPDIFNAEFKYNAAKNRDLINFEK